MGTGKPFKLDPPATADGELERMALFRFFSIAHLLPEVTQFEVGLSGRGALAATGRKVEYIHARGQREVRRAAASMRAQSLVLEVPG